MWTLLIGLFRVCRYSLTLAAAPSLPFGVEFVRKEEEVSPFLTSGVQKAGGVGLRWRVCLSRTSPWAVWSCRGWSSCRTMILHQSECCPYHEWQDGRWFPPTVAGFFLRSSHGLDELTERAHRFYCSVPVFQG